MNLIQHLLYAPTGKTQGRLLTFLLALLLPLVTNAQLSVTLGGTSPTCNGWTNGTVSANATGGQQPYTYLWNTGATTSHLVGVGAGFYSVTVTDALSQTATASGDLIQPAAVVATIVLQDACSGNGNAKAFVSGGTPPYWFAWSNGTPVAEVTGLPVGIHCVTITDANGCADVECVNVPAAMTLDIVVKGLACFNFCDASVEAIVSGGTGPYTYNWDNGAVGEVNPNLGPGIYTVTVTDANGCTATGTGIVSNPPEITVNVSVTHPPCATGGTGSATAVPSGGTAPYTFLWNFGATTATVSGLIPGTYTVTVTDAVGCSKAVEVIVVPAADIVLDIQEVSSSQCGIADGAASVAVVSGGTAPFSILWSNGATTSTITGLFPGVYGVVVTDANGCAAIGQAVVSGTPAIDLHIMGVNAGCAANGSANAMVMPGSGTPPFTYLWSTGETTPIINNLTAGTYSVTVTDAAGCTATDQVTVTGAVPINVSTTGTPVSCYSGSDGTASATGTGGTGTLTFAWSNGATGANISGLAVGTYFVTVTDSGSGCTALGSVFIPQPTELVATATGVNETCHGNDGSATASASGGTAPYSFLWSTGATVATTIGLSAGTYTVTVTDANGCTATASVTIDLDPSPEVSISITTISDINANDGKLTANVTGGTAPTSILWSTGATTSMISNLGPGTYSVTVTDANGCTDDETVILYNPACLGDRIWNDVNRNGCQEGGEFGIAAVLVTLTGTDLYGQSVTRTTHTSSVGQYLFKGLVPGTYRVHVTAPANFTYTLANNCTGDFTDSDIDPTTGTSGDYTLAEAQCNITVDGGLYDVCLNISKPGVICCDQTLCGPGNDPAPITSVLPAIDGGGPIEYMWMYSNVPGPFNTATWFPIPGATGLSYDPGPLSQTTFFIRCAKVVTCSDWLESNIVTVTVGNVAVAEINGPTIVCQGILTSFSATPQPAGATYSWNLGPWSSPSTSNQPNVNVTWNSWGVVYVTLTVVNNGCTSTASKAIAITTNPSFCGSPLVVNINDQGKKVRAEWSAVYMPEDIEFAVQRSADGVHFKDIALIPQTYGAGTLFYSYEDESPKVGNAFYRVESRMNGAHLRYSNAERIMRFEGRQAFTAYPNPVSDELTIESSGEVSTPVMVEVLNLNGSLITVENIAKDDISHQVNLSELKAGIYILRLTYNEGEKEMLRIVKH